MLNLGLTIMEGGRTLCQTGKWSGKNESSHRAKLYYPVKGQGWVKAGENITQLRPGQLYFIPPHVVLSYGTSSQIMIEWLHFRLQSPLLDLRLSSAPKVHLFSKTITGRWKPTCNLIDRFMQERSVNDAFRIQAMLLELTGLILTDLPEENPQGRLVRERLVPALQLLDDQSVKHPSLRDIARTVNLSPEHFHRLFRSTFHTTPHQYALDRRMALAKTLLAEGHVSVTEAAEQCGYDDPFYFSRVFTHHFGASPGRVRRGLAIIGPKP